MTHVLCHSFINIMKIMDKIAKDEEGNVDKHQVAVYLKLAKAFETLSLKRKALQDFDSQGRSKTLKNDESQACCHETPSMIARNQSRIYKPKMYQRRLNLQAKDVSNSHSRNPEKSKPRKFKRTAKSPHS